MDRGTLLLIALALIACAGVVLGGAGVVLFRRDKAADSVESEPGEGGAS